jgi:uncharacterized membrane protein YesL
MFNLIEIIFTYLKVRLGMSYYTNQRVQPITQKLSNIFRSFISNVPNLHTVTFVNSTPTRLQYNITLSDNNTISLTLEMVNHNDVILLFSGTTITDYERLSNILQTTFIIFTHIKSNILLDFQSL